jgi:hypothetical protein
MENKKKTRFQFDKSHDLPNTNRFGLKMKYTSPNVSPYLTLFGLDTKKCWEEIITYFPFPKFLYLRQDHRLLAKLMPTFGDRGCHVVSVMNPYCRILGYLDLSRYFSSK